MLTQKQDLRSGIPLWLDKNTRRIASRPGLGRNHSDVIVVGSGISGALVADALQQAGQDVLVIDRRRPMAGSTPASTALLQSELDTPLTHLARKVGTRQAARAWQRSAQSVDALKNRVADLNLDCEFLPRNSLYLPGNVLDAAGLRHEHEARRRAGLRCELLSRADVLHIAGIKAGAAILTRGNAEADPVKMLAALWRNFLQGGGRITSLLEIAHLDEGKSRVRLEAVDGRKMTARHVVFCTGYEVMKAFKPKGFNIISTWVIATKPQPRRLWPGRELIWEAADPYLYVRTTGDGRVIAGGADEDFADEDKRDALIARKSKLIAKQASRYFPDIDFTPEYCWTGNFGESPTGLPAIGLLEGYRRAYQVLGFGGNGITFSMLAAQMISASIMGFSDPDSDIFAP